MTIFTKLPVAFVLTCSVINSIAQAETLTGNVVRITDGDTLVVLDETKSENKIRLQGIDAPERGQAFGTKSKEHLSDLVAGEFVVVEYQKRDRYQRILGKVLFNGEDINLVQITSGMAWHYKKYQGEQSSADRIRYSDAELEARREKGGLWHDPEPVPPWEFRQAKREYIKSMVPITGSKSMVNEEP